MKKTVLRDYARLIARTGINIQKGQAVIIHAGLDQPEFVQMLVEECYKAKASEVTVQWSYQNLTKLHFRYQSVKTLGTMEEWEKAREQFYCDTLPARIHLLSEDPDGLKGINMTKMAKANQMRYPIMKGYRDQRQNLEQWCGAAVPGVAWAKKVFPGQPKGKAVELLWQAILDAARVCDDSVKAWEEHDADLAARCDYLTGLNIDSLHLTADNGTDLTVGLIPQSKFCGGGETLRNGVFFNPNIPTEECFTSPMRERTEGIVYSTKPLSYQGQLIDNFWMRFEAGKVVDCGAETGEALLKTLLAMDEGAAYLGECALVPQDSPIARSGLLFYNTLFDENAACHLAIGMGFPETIRGFQDMNWDDLRALGLNDSMVHEDFMVGCDSMDITATCRDGSVVQIFKDGNWAF